MDFMVIDTIFGKRFYLFIILELKTRKIIRSDLTESPCREFVKQRIELLSEQFQDQEITLIHDNAPQFTSIDYSWYNAVGRIPDSTNSNLVLEKSRKSQFWAVYIIHITGAVLKS
jgi:hypothetical protein